MDIKIGDKDVGFVFQGEELIYPAYVKDGLVLHYDFSAMRNNDVTRGVARDLSGNENDGVLENFAFDEGSGYADNGLEFDGVDDYVEAGAINTDEISIEAVYMYSEYTEFPRLISEKYARFDIWLGSRGDINVIIGGKTYRFSGTMLSITTICITVSSVDVTCYIDGLYDSKQTLISPITEHDYFIVGKSILSGSVFDGKIFSVRRYGRVLTPEEIQHNYKIDKHRFNIQD